MKDVLKILCFLMKCGNDENSPYFLIYSDSIFTMWSKQIALDWRENLTDFLTNDLVVRFWIYVCFDCFIWGPLNSHRRLFGKLSRIKRKAAWFSWKVTISICCFFKVRTVLLARFLACTWVGPDLKIWKSWLVSGNNFLLPDTVFFSFLLRWYFTMLFRGKLSLTKSSL